VRAAVRFQEMKSPLPLPARAIEILQWWNLAGDLRRRLEFNGNAASQV
jgi:hypothetical protein